MASNEIKISVDEESVARAAATIREASRQLAESIGRLGGSAVEPWTIETPKARLRCYVYVDDENQDHWVPADGSGVPPDPSWRRLYVEKRA